jgi:hypothetical protein
MIAIVTAATIVLVVSLVTTIRAMTANVMFTIVSVVIFIIVPVVMMGPYSGLMRAVFVAIQVNTV